MDLLIPKSEADMTPTWITQATSLKPIPSTIKITTNVQAGQGILSSLYRLQFTSESGTEESILVKLLPKNQEHLALNIDQGCNQREVQFYSKILPEIAHISPSLSEQMCKFYNGKFEGSGETFESLLIMEDLKPLGYFLLQTDSPNWTRNVEKATVFLAKLHAFGNLIEKKNNLSLPEIFSFHWKPNDSIDFYMDFAKGIINQFSNLLVKNKTPEVIRQAYQKLNEKIDKVVQKCFEMGTKLPVLIHGDFYKSNILVNESEANSSVKVVDWQFTGYVDATYELSVFLLTSLPIDELNRKNIDIYVRLYWNEFIKSCGENGSKYEGRIEEEFINFFNTWGIGLGYTFLMVTPLEAYGDMQRPSKMAEIMQEEYQLCDFLLSNL